MKRGAACLSSPVMLGLAQLALACGAPPAPLATPAPAPAPALTAPDAAPAATGQDGGARVELPAASVPPAAQLLRDGFEQRHSERALPRASRGDAPPRAVVAKEPGKARFIVDDPSMRLLVWADHSALWETPLAVTALTRHPGKPGPKERVFVAPGAFVERKAEKNDFVRVSAHDRTFRVEGFLPAAALGRVYLPAEVPAVQAADWWALSRDAALLDKPGGAALGKLLDTAPPQVGVAELSKGAAWFVEIAYRSPSLSVRGFVPKSALSPLQGGGWGSGYGSIGRRVPPEETLTFPSGACLYVEPWGEVVGVLRLARTVTVHIEEGARAGWRELELSWAGTRVWLPREGASTDAPPKAPPGKSLSLAEGFSCAEAPRR